MSRGIGIRVFFSPYIQISYFIYNVII